MNLYIKIPDIKWDMIICDEAHSLGAFPKPNKRARDIKNIIKNPCQSCITVRYTNTGVL